MLEYFDWLNNIYHTYRIVYLNQYTKLELINNYSKDGHLVSIYIDPGCDNK